MYLTPLIERDVDVWQDVESNLQCEVIKLLALVPSFILGQTPQLTGNK